MLQAYCGSSSLVTGLCVPSSTISLLSAQMQAHMMSHEMASIFSSHDILGLRGQQAIENMSESLCCLAQHLFKQVTC